MLHWRLFNPFRSCHQQLVTAAVAIGCCYQLLPVPRLPLHICCVCCCCCWLQEKKAAEEARKKELAELFATTIKQPKVPAGAQQPGTRRGAAHSVHQSVAGCKYRSSNG
jgi:hypothetical protein